MIHLGSVPASTTVYIPFTTYAGSTGASVTCTGLAVTDIEIYKNGSTTQRSSDAGIALLDTDGIDFDLITGLHGFSIDLSDNTDASFYAVGSWYWVVVSAITVDSQTVTFLAATFRIAPAEALTGHPKTDVGGWLGTAPATPTVAGVPEVDVTHYAGSTTDVSTIPASVAAVLVDTGTTLDALIQDIPTVAEFNARTLAAADYFDPAADTVATVTNLTNAPTAGDLTAAMKASVNAEVVDVLTTDTFAELGAVPAATSSLKDKLTYMFMWFRNLSTQTATTRILKADDTTTTVATETVSDNGTTYTKGEAT